MNPELDRYLQTVNTEHNRLIDTAIGWIMDGWGLIREDAITGPMIAAALFNQAAATDEEGITLEYPNTLRRIAFEILRLDGHGDCPHCKPPAVTGTRNGYTCPAHRPPEPAI